MENVSSEERIVVPYRRHGSASALPAEDQQLIRKAVEAADKAYAPYSRFKVGAALRLKDGNTYTGNNQENASYPAGTCAERSALHAAMSQHPDGHVVTMAVVVPQLGADKPPVPPCGICRQALVEQEKRQGAPLRLLLATAGGEVIELADAGSLLPFSFDSSYL